MGFLKHANFGGYRGKSFWDFSSMKIWGILRENVVGFSKHEKFWGCRRKFVWDFSSMRISGDIERKICGTFQA